MYKSGVPSWWYSATVRTPTRFPTWAMQSPRVSSAAEHDDVDPQIRNVPRYFGENQRWQGNDLHILERWQLSPCESFIQDSSRPLRTCRIQRALRRNLEYLGRFSQS